MARGSFHKRVGEQREKQILDLLKTPMTVLQLGDELGLCPSGIAVYIGRLRAAPKRIYVSGHVRPMGSGGVPAVIWSAGNRDDVEFVPLCILTPKTTAKQRMAQVLDLLAEKPRTVRDLSELLFMVPRASGRYVTQLRKEKKIYVKTWELRPPTEGTRSHVWSPLYAVGNKPDKPAPPVETPKQRHARLHKNPEYREKRKLEQRARYAVDKAKKKKHNIFSALGL